MGLGRRSSLTVMVLLVFVSTYLTLYAVVLHSVVARDIYEDPVSGGVFWRSGPSGSLFPWPMEPGMLEVLTRLNEVDLFVYRYLVKTWALVGLSVLMWIIAGLAVFRARSSVR